MTIRAELDDGRKLEFPDGTDPAIIQATIKSMLRREDTGIIKGFDRPTAAEKARTSFGEGLVKEAPRTLAGVAGGAAAAAAKFGLKKAAGGVGIVAGGAEAWKQVGQQISDAILQSRYPGLTPEEIGLEAPQTAEEAATKIAKTGVVEAATELVPSAVVAGVKGAAKKLLPSRVAGLSDELEKAVGITKKAGLEIDPTLIPGERVKSKVLDSMQDIADSALFGTKLDKYSIARQAQLNEAYQTILDKVGPETNPEEFGQLFIDLINKRTSLADEQANVMYSRVKELLPADKTVGDRVVPGVPISTKSIRAAVTPVLKQIERIEGIGKKSISSTALESLAKLEDTISYEDAIFLRSTLLEESRRLRSALQGRPRAAAELTKAITALDSTIERTLRGSGFTEALDSWRAANSFYRQNKNTFDNDFIRQALKRAESTRMGVASISSMILQKNKGAVIRSIKEIVPDEFDRLKSIALQGMWDASTHPETGNILGTNLKAQLKRLGPDTVNNLFTGQERRQLNALIDVLTSAQAKAEGTAGGVFIKLKQSGAITQLAGTALLGAGGATLDPATAATGMAFLILPAVTARLLLNPKSSKLLIEGLKLSADSPRVPGLAARLMSYIIRANREVEGSKND